MIKRLDILTSTTIALDDYRGSLSSIRIRVRRVESILRPLATILPLKQHLGLRIPTTRSKNMVKNGIHS